MKLSQLFLGGLLLVGGLAAQAADPYLARNLASTCANCHGTDGRGHLGFGMEPLYGMPKEKILLRLEDFRNGTTPSTIMHQIAKGYTPAQLELVATYFADRPRQRQE